MKYSHVTQSPTSDTLDSIIGTIEQCVADKTYDNVYAAMAYVSVAGVRRLLDVLHDRTINLSRWLIGIDDAVTQPGAIKLCRDLDNSSTRVASFEEDSLRFHPKVLLFTSSSDPSKGIMMVGSANLTHHGLERNAESVVFLHADSRADVRELMARWSELWRLGRSMTSADLRDYEDRYNKNKTIRTKLVRSRKPRKTPKSKRTRTVLTSDTAELDPSLASTCWIECGYITAMGRELELKAEQGIFFGLNPKGEAPRHFNFELSNRKTTSLRLKFQGNAMWRLQFTNDVPEVARGLRPRTRGGKLGRSPWVAVIRRTKQANLFSLRFVRLRSHAYRDLKKRSYAIGAVGKTSAREYGWL